MRENSAEEERGKKKNEERRRKRKEEERRKRKKMNKIEISVFGFLDVVKVSRTFRTNLHVALE